MKRLFITALAIIGLAALTLPAGAESKGKEITLSGKACCAKCCLKQGDTCQNVLSVEKNGKTTTYYLADNQVSKDFHGEVCKKPKENVSVTGTCKKEGDKLVVTASKIK